MLCFGTKKSTYHRTEDSMLIFAPFQPDCYELLCGNVLKVVDEELNELKEFLLHASRLPGNLLRSLAERVLVLQQEVVGVVPVVDGRDGVQDGSTQARRDAFHED